MQRILTIRPAGQSDTLGAVDSVVLDAGDRLRRRIVLITEKGISVLLDFPKPVMLRDGDGLVLEDGSVVVVAGQPEHLVELSTRTPLEFVRLAWHIGNRHTDVQFVEARLRIRRDNVLEEMVKGLGAIVKQIEAPFDPEPAAPHGHDHGP